MSTPSPTPNLVIIGAAGGSTITANGTDGFGPPVRVTLSADFTYRAALYSDGWPAKPHPGAAPGAPLGTIPAGATSLFWPCEAAAIVAAGIGAYA